MIRALPLIIASLLGVFSGSIRLASGGDTSEIHFKKFQNLVGCEMRELTAGRRLEEGEFGRDGRFYIL